MIKLTSSLSYNKDLSYMVGSAVGGIILEKVIRWWYNHNKREFILFPKPIEHIHYITGKSWKEQSALSVDDLKYGLGYVGTRITEKNVRDAVLMDVRPDFDTSGKLTNSNHLILYSTRNKAMYFELNEDLAEKAINLYLSGEWKDYIAPEPMEVEPIKSLSIEEIREISSFGNFQLPVLVTEEENG